MILKSKDYSKPIQDALSDNVDIVGNTLLVQILEEEAPTTKSGLVMSTPENHVRKSFTEKDYIWCEVIAVGGGYEDGECISKPGNVLLVPPAAVSIFPHFGGIMDGSIARVRDDAVSMRFSSLEATKAFFEKITSSI